MAIVDREWNGHWTDDPYRDWHRIDRARALAEVERFVGRVQRGDFQHPAVQVRPVVPRPGADWFLTDQPVVAEPRPDVNPELRAAVATFDARRLVAEQIAAREAEWQHEQRKAAAALARARGEV